MSFRILPTLVLFTASAIVVGCSSATPAPRPTARDDAPAVTVIYPKKQTIRRIIEQPGHIVAIEQTPIYGRIPGYVSEVSVDMNSVVKKGQILTKLAVPEMDDDLKHKESLVEQAKAEFVQARRMEETAKANLTTATAAIAEVEAGRKRAHAFRERWSAEYERMEKLVRSNSIEAQVRDEARNQFLSADAACDEIEAKIKSAHAAKEESRTRLNKAVADVSAAQARVSVAAADAQRLRLSPGATFTPGIL